MTNSSTALKRLGVAGLSAVTIGAGMAAFAASSGSAATADITAVTLTPSAAVSSTGGNTCQEYLVKATEADPATAGSVTVVLQPTGAIDSEFCTTNPNTTNNVVASAGSADAASFGLNASNVVSFGVMEHGTATAGTIGITAFPQNGTVSTATPTGVPTDDATLHIVKATDQADAVTTLTTSPTSQTVTAGPGTATYEVKAINGFASVVSDAVITYTVKSSRGSAAGVPGTCTTNGLGLAMCTVQLPTETSVESGPYTVTFSAAHSGTAPATTTTATLTTVAAAPANATVQVTCDATSKRNELNDCAVPTTATTTTFTADVTTPATTNTAVGASVPGAVVTFASSPTANGTLSPTSCVTAANGTCTTTLTFAAAPTSSITTVTASLSNGHSGSGTVTQDNNFMAAPTNVRVAAADPTAIVGKGDLITATVTNQFGNPVGVSNNPPSVVFTVDGAGVFGNGTQSQTVDTGLNGQAQVQVGATAIGPVNVTAVIAVAPNTPNCQSAAPAGGVAGDCKASTAVIFTKGSTGPTTTTEHPLITSISSSRSGSATIHVTSDPNVVGATVHYYRVSASGKRHLLATGKTGASGKASKTIHGLTPGKTYNFQVRVYNAHRKKIVPGLSSTISKQIA